MELTREELRLIEHMRKNCVSEECDGAILDYVIERCKEAIDPATEPVDGPSDTGLLDFLVRESADLQERQGQWTVATQRWRGPTCRDAREAIRDAMKREGE